MSALKLVDGGGPCYLQIQHWVVRQIRVGEFTPGQCLPSVRELAAEIGVNANTVARAYRELAGVGVLTGRPGQATFVTEYASDILRGTQETKQDAIKALFRHALQIARETEGIRFRDIHRIFEEAFWECITQPRDSVKEKESDNTDASDWITGLS